MAQEIFGKANLRDENNSLRVSLMKIKDEKNDLVNQVNILIFKISEFNVLFKQLEDAESLRQKAMFELGRLANRK